ncbi:1-acyl-sn-glycerol-3-phosphate acyltransferase [Sansalvadorimonas sp. 2012CJ34-2]|uniref:1-acyl-sn-glycerol-3-phosphate acyltransferase n=1 Tax=Parendozoicomonas callyspongiae TaxID=2942213 RepID=A0ABT0PG64_9GAMM|nr:lysophospholipid acyltransferase family protein [Sansalvadorimonas sp. 2012CJ34-2]MCL6270372.1 1-acyl-sn-glycerol-3-phosphate acyltransferase [Sansalvadorimonas sp. 2012CJ34-2]
MNENPVVIKSETVNSATEAQDANTRSDHDQAIGFDPLAFPLRLVRVVLLAGLILTGLLLACWIQILNWSGKQNQVSERTNSIRLSLKQWWLKVLCLIMGVKIHRQGGPWTNPVLMVCNHISWLDIPVLGASVPFHFLAKSEIRKWPIIGWLANVTGTLFIRRKSGDSGKVSRDLARYLGQGHGVLVFPEGTTTDGYQVKPFHDRLLKSAISSHVALQPITLAYCEAGKPHPRVPFIGDDSLVPSIWKLLGERSIHVHLQYHPPIMSFEQDSRQLARQAQFTVKKGLKAIFPLLGDR